MRHTPPPILSELNLEGYDIIPFPSHNYTKGRQDTPCTHVVYHCMGTSLEESIRILTLPPNMGGPGVSAHFFIPHLTARELQKHYSLLFNNFKFEFLDKIPIIYLVDPKNTAWHTGYSSWKDLNTLPNCEKSLNACTIGIEFSTPGYSKNETDWWYFTPYHKKQIETGANLTSYLMATYQMNKENLLAHSDIAPSRKTDPGLYFPWKEIYKEYALGLWPESKNSQKLFIFPNTSKLYSFISKKLKAIGYPCPLYKKNQWTRKDNQILKDCTNAFKLHFLNDQALVDPSYPFENQLIQRLIDFQT